MPRSRCAEPVGVVRVVRGAACLAGRGADPTGERVPVRFEVPGQHRTGRLPLLPVGQLTMRLTVEEWGERAFQVRDPNGVIIQLGDWNGSAS